MYASILSTNLEKCLKPTSVLLNKVLTTSLPTKLLWDGPLSYSTPFSLQQKQVSLDSSQRYQLSVSNIYDLCRQTKKLNTYGTICTVDSHISPKFGGSLSKTLLRVFPLLRELKRTKKGKILDFSVLSLKIQSTYIDKVDFLVLVDRIVLNYSLFSR